LVTNETERRLFIHQIFTTSELNQTIYIADEIAITDGFVKFCPFEIDSPKGKSDNKNDDTFILPARVIMKIVKSKELPEKFEFKKRKYVY
jgi:hypothetical protein